MTCLADRYHDGSYSKTSTLRILVPDGVHDEKTNKQSKCTYKVNKYINK
jgi:hypothetical protein